MVQRIMKNRLPRLATLFFSVALVSGCATTGGVNNSYSCPVDDENIVEISKDKIHASGCALNNALGEPQRGYRGDALSYNPRSMFECGFRRATDGSRVLDTLSCVELVEDLGQSL